MTELASAELVVVQGYCRGEITGKALRIPDPDPDAEPGDTIVAPVVSEPVAAPGQLNAPMLVALAAHAHIKTQRRETLPVDSTGYWAIPAVATNDPDVTVYAGRKITLPDGTTRVIQIPFNAPAVAATADMVAQVNTGLGGNALTVGGPVRAIWFTDAADFTIPTPTGGPAIYTAAQVDSIVAGLAAPAWTSIQGRPSFAAIAGSGSATDLVAGTVPDARLASTIARQTAVDAKVDRTLVDAKGDMLVGSADDTLVRVPVGVDGRVWTADSTAPNGAAWLTPTGGGGGGSGSPDIPEYSRVPLTAALATPGDLLTKLVSYNTTSAITQPMPLAQPGRYFAVRWDAGTAALTLTVQARTDTATVTSGSATVSDTAVLAADQGRAVTGTGIPPGSYVGTVTAGTSFLLSSSPTSQVNVNATASSSQVVIADQVGETLAASFTVPVLGDVHLLHCTHQGLWRTVLGHKRQSELDTRNDARYVARAALFGAAANTAPPVCEYQLTTAYTGLTANDYLMSGNMSAVTDDLTMFSTAFGFYRVIIPYAGRWNVEWDVHSSATTGYGAVKVLLNLANGSSTPTGISNNSIMEANATPDSRGTPIMLNRSRVFAAGDTLAFTVQGSVTFDMPVSALGGIRTRFCVRWLGAK